MLDKGTIDMCELLSNEFEIYLEATNGITDSESLTKILRKSIDYKSHFFTKKILDKEDRKQLQIYLSWLFNQLAFIALHTKEKLLEDANIELQKLLAHESYVLQRWWFHQLISLYTSFLEQALLWKETESIAIKFSDQPSPDDLNKVNTKLRFLKLEIKSDQQVCNVMKCCLSVLSSSILHYCNIKPDLAIKSFSAVHDVLRQKALSYKVQALEFFKLYFDCLATFADIETQLFLSTMETLSITFKNIPAMMLHESNAALQEFQSQTESFFSEVPVKRMKFNNQSNLEGLVCSTCEILYHELKNTKQSWFNQKIPDLLTNMLVKVFDNFEFNLSTTKMFRNLLEFDGQSTVALLKYLIVSEIESNVDINSEIIDVTSVSESWKFIYEATIKLLDDLIKNIEKPNFITHLGSIADYFILAIQVQFATSRRFQFLQGMRSLEENESSPKWKIKPIEFRLFNEIEDFNQKLLSAIEKTKIDAQIARCSMDIFSSILQLNDNSNIVDTVKQVLVAIVASPFYASLYNNSKYNKLGGFQKIMQILPANFKNFFSGPVFKDHLDVMQCDSIELLSHLEITKIPTPCYWLIENIIIYTLTEGNEELKKSFFNSFLNFALNNKMPIWFEKYQKLLLDFKDSKLVLLPLQSMLCLTRHDVKVLKLHSKENGFRYSIVCNKCALSKFGPKNTSTNDDQRLLAIAKISKGLIVNREHNESISLSINTTLLFNQPKDFIIELLPHIPSMLNHSEDFQMWVISDAGKSFFEKIFVMDEKVLESLNENLKDILINIHQLDITAKQKKEIFNNCFAQIFAVALFAAKGSTPNDEKLQLLAINLNFIIATNFVDETQMVQSFKIFLMFIIPNNSQLMGEASDLALNMAERNGISLFQLFNWHKTFLMHQITRMLIVNFLTHKEKFSNSLINLSRRLNFPRMRELIPDILGIIIAVTIPLSLKSQKLLCPLEELCSLIAVPLPQAIEDNILQIYHEIYTTQSQEDIKKCIKIIEDKARKPLRELLISNKKEINDEVLIYYHKAQPFVIEVMSSLLEKERRVPTMDEIADDIKTRFLGVLIHFEPYLTSVECERIVNKNFLLSLGDIIRMLGTNRVSSYCFKIISVLKVAIEHASYDLSEICIKVWDILIRTCSVSSLGPILSTIFVSLEVFTDKFPNEVKEIFKYLVVENSNLLSRYISDLFFIEKTRIDPEIKVIVLSLMRSQKMRDEENFHTNLGSLMRYLNSENSDLKIRVYCIQYMRELFKKHRVELNDKICGKMTMDSTIEELLHILINNCKSTTTGMLQLATAECLGELGAIEPSLQQQNYASQEEFPKTIHSDEFAKMALAQLCRSYASYKSDTKYIDALSLAIQQILRSRDVTVENSRDHEVWNAIPEKIRPLMEPLLRSNYSPKQKQVTNDFPIFWNQSQTLSDWTMQFASFLISRITDEKTKYLLECVKPSMKNNQYTTSMFFPYILLHNLEINDITTHRMIKEEIQHVFDNVMEKDCFDQTRDGNHRKPLFVKDFAFRPIHYNKNQSPENSMKSVAIKVAKLIFEVFDFLENYRRTHNGATTKLITDFLSNFDTEEMAEVNYKCDEYSRAMIYFEARIKNIKQKEDLQPKLKFLTNIYAKLGNPDSVEGIQALKTSEWSLEEKLMISNVTGNYQDSAATCERMMQIGLPDVENMQHMLNTFIALDQPETALLVYENMIRKLSDSQQQTISREFKAEPLWRLSRFDELEELLKETTVQQSTSWGVRCGQLMLKFRSENTDIFQSELRNTRLAMIKNLKISGNEQTAYGKNYRGIINLHLISEIEKANEAYEQIKISTNNNRLEIVKNLVNDWNLRMEFVQQGAVIEEPIFCFRRIVLSETKQMLKKCGPTVRPVLDLINAEIGKLWIKSTKLACKSKMYQQAQIYILNAESYEPKELFLEKAKLDWIKGDQVNAFQVLELGTSKLLGNNDIQQLSKEDKIIYSKGKLMCARYNAEAINLDFEANKKLFRDARVKGVECEKVYLLLAEYMDRHYCSGDDQKTVPVCHLNQINEVMDNYFKSMVFGSAYVFQSMPRFLSIWLDATDSYSNRTEINQMNKIVENAAKRLDVEYFYTAFSQLISRICHKSQDVFAVLKTILVKLIKAYPQQSFWFLIPMLRSKDTQRVKQCKLILHDSRLEHLQNLVKEFNSLHQNWIKLASMEIGKDVKEFSLKTSGLTHLSKPSKAGIIMPFVANLQMSRVWKDNKFKFASSMVYIHKMKERVVMMTSLVRPRKVTLIGDDGKEYSMLFKKDDLRIDWRFLELSAIVKEFLHNDPESRQRQLTTRIYAACPLDETYGVIEWVPNLRTFKDIIISEYIKKNHKLPANAKLKSVNDLRRIEDKVQEYHRLTKIFYPALGDYFRKQFSSPQNYYKARLSYIRTTAAMSIIGYILGLGDRHGENILIDIRSGETFHVDFNCLFNKGENLTVPETVPFRLTHNMIDAMGVLGIEGPFRKSCEIFLRVMQKERNTLMSYLRPLAYGVQHKTVLSRNTSEHIEAESVESIKSIEMRLKGIVRKYKGSSGIPLSTEGQVNFIIGEATSAENLASMYFGWAPWM